MSDRALIECGLPEALAAERGVLAAVMVTDGVALAEEFALVADDFGSERHRKVFRVLNDLAAERQPCDFVTVDAALRARGWADEVGSPHSLVALTEGFPRSANIAHYAALVRRAAKKRRLLAVARELEAEALEEGTEPDSAAAASAERLLGIAAETGADTGPQPAARGMAAMVAEAARASASASRTVGLPTGLGCLDDETRGLRRGEFVVVGGYPGDGKSALALALAAENARHNTPAVLFSLEMSREQVQQRLLAAYSTVPYWRLRNAQLRLLDRSELDAATARIGAWPLLVDDAPGLSVSELCARARLAIRHHGAQLVVVDYVRMLRADGPDLRQRINAASDALRRLAKTENVAAVGLSQLRRPPAGASRSPSLDDLKESGNLGEDAHLVLLVSREFRDGRPTGSATVTIAKQRGGRTGPLAVRFDSDRMRFFGAAE